ncbi:MAG: HdeD family acid-resistance protein [Mycobacterium sp.]|uniref:HdeD family acid-resistance protein n=1 Tax=Mycobacterium sp. TaxID=1785 RepID=UPI001EC910DD|nr:HdeD family acid-resistance protein [Mycobacterium sp.]MBW0018275.1 HdeD family acid-resistance protein [Mycobacterium sp.]
MQKSTENPSVFRHLWKSMLALGLLGLTLGVVVLIWPGKSVVVAAALFGVYLLASGITQAIAAFTVDVSTSSRVVLSISGALSVALGVYAFHDFNNGAALWVLATWIGIGFMFQGAAETVVAINHKELPERGWHIFAGVLSLLAGMVVIALPISSILVLAIVAGAWLVVIGTAQVVWAVKARKAGAEVERVVDSLTPNPIG